MEKELPIGWVNIVLEDLYSHVTGGDWGLDPQTENTEGFSKVVCIRGGELRNWRVEKGRTASIRLVKNTSINTRKLIIGDILLEISGGGPDQPVGRTVIIDDEVFKNFPELPIICTNFLRLLRLVEIVNKEYVNQYLQYFYTSGEVVKYQGGSNNLRNLKFGDYSSIEIPLPSLPEQQRIVAKLDTLFGHLDALKTRLERIPQLLKEFRQKVLTQAVTGKLTEEWREGRELEEWNTKNLNQLGEVTGGITLNSTRNELPLKMPYLRVANVYSNRLELGEIKTIGVAEKEIERTLLQKGDLLIVEGNGSPDQIGRVSQWNNEIENCLHQNHLIKYRPNEKVNSKFVLYFILSDLGRQQIQEISKSSSGLYTLSLSKVAMLEIEITDLLEQQEIVRRVESLFANADQIEAGYLKLKAKIDQLPQALLAKAFRGELVPQLPTDGDATELLEEIKKAKGGK